MIFRFSQVVAFRFSQILIIFENHRLIWQKGPKGVRAATGLVGGLFGIFLISELSWVKE